MQAGRSSLRRRMLFTLLGCFVPMVVVISLLFVRSFLAQRQADIEALRYAAEDIRVTLDRFADGVYSVSDAFSTDERLIEILDRDYSADPLAKQYAVTYTNGALFESYSRLVHQEKIAAIYLPARREVFDFRDPNQVTTLLVKQFEAMQVDASDKLGRFFFYPLQKNFLSTETYGEARRDMVVLGSRRVYSALKSGYPYVHIFAIEEQTLYELYQYQAKRLGADVYVLDPDGGLISSTNEEAVAAGKAPKVARATAGRGSGLMTAQVDGVDYSVAVSVGESTGWRVVVFVPTVTLTAQAAQGWHFVEWKSDDVTVSDNAFLMPEQAVTVTAVFAQDSQPSGVDKTLLYCQGFVILTGLVLGNLAYLFGHPLVSIYNSDEAVIQQGIIRLGYIARTYAICGVMDTMVGSLRGLGYSIVPMVVSLIGACGLRIVWIFTIFQMDKTLECLYVSYPISWILTAGVHLICYLLVRKKAFARAEQGALN